MFIPYQVDVPFNHRPVMNWVVFAGVILVFCVQVAIVVEEISSERSVPFEEREAKEQAAEEPAEAGKISQFFLTGWGLKGLLGHMWLHGGLSHLIGNLIFLWLFGNAVCSKLGNRIYLPIYVGLGLVAAATHLIFVGGPMIGASGAINGLVGMYLVFFPENSISCFFFLLLRPVTFSISGYWMILLWFVFDIWGAMKGGSGVAYFAHVGGFLAGFALAILMVARKWVVMERDEKSLLQMLRLQKKEIPEEHRRYFAPWETSQPEEAEPETIALEPEKPKEEFIRFMCPCGKRVKVPAGYAGMTGRCPACGKRLRIPKKP